MTVGRKNETLLLAPSLYILAFRSADSVTRVGMSDAECLKRELSLIQAGLLIS